MSLSYAALLPWILIAAPTNSVHCAASLVHRREKLIIDMTPALSTSLTCSAVSADGAWIAVSDAYEVKVFAVTLSDDGDSVARVSRVKSFGLDLEMGGASALTFVSDQYDGDDEDMIEDEQPACGTRLVVCGLDSIVRVFEAAVVADSEDEDENEDVDVQFILLKSLDMHTGSSSKSNSTVTPLSSTNNDSDAMDLDLLQVIETDKEMAAKSRRQQQKSSVSNAQGQQTILSVVASDDGKWLVTGDSGNRIVITNLLTLKVMQF